MNLDEQLPAIRYCVAETVRRRLLTGAPVPEWMRRLDHHLRAMSAHGPKPVAVQPQSETEVIDTATAAQILGCSRRHVTRLAADLDGQQIAGRWIFHHHNVTEYAQAKRTDT